jgi:hypothetical protein
MQMLILFKKDEFSQQRLFMVISVLPMVGGSLWFLPPLKLVAMI